MFHSSRTTLRELKKRYLNILKKCLLANLMAFSFVLPVMAEETVTTRQIISDIVNYSNDIIYSDISVANGSGGAILVDSNGSLSFEGNIKLISNSAPNGSGGAIYNIGYLYLLGETIFGGESIKTTDPETGKEIVIALGNNAKQGGALYSAGGTISDNKEVYGAVLGKVSFVNNTAISEGGAVYNVGDWRGTGYMHFTDNALFEGNLAVFGGGIYNNSGKILFSKNSIFQNNIVTGKNAQGGSLFSGNYTNNSSSVIFNKAEFYNNKSISTSGLARGGAIWSKQELIFNGEAIFGKYEKDDDGNYLFDENTDLITKGNLSISETGLANSGALFIESPNSNTQALIETQRFVSFNKAASFIGNIADGKTTATGGAIQNQGSDVRDTLDQIVNYGLIFKDTAKFELNKTISRTDYSRGGAIYNTGTLKFQNHVSFGGYLTNKSNDFVLNSNGEKISIGNSAYAKEYQDSNGLLTSGSAEGGALYTTSSSVTVVNSADFIGNKVISDKNNGNGGGIYNEGKIIFQSDADFIDNKVIAKTTAKGGAIHNGVDGLITFNNSYFLNNSAQSESGEAEGGAIYNEGTLTFNGENIFENNKTNGKLNDIHNVGSILVKGSLTTNGGVTGNGSVTIDKEGVLDIKIGTVEVGEMTLKDGALLKIGVNSLTEHGKVNGLVTGNETSKIALNLAIDTKNGVYQVFDRDNDLTLQENKLFNIKDLENGAYEVSKKTSENLMKDFDMSESESAVAVALIESESYHKAFNQVQEEMLEALQSTDKSQVEKAKKALKAIGKSEQSSAQAVASNHVGAVGKVVGGEMKGGSMKGHSGGEEAPRAKVYIKGLYDKTKSTMGDGFKARSQGAVLGVQSEVTDSLTLGVGYATSKTTAKEDLRRTEVDTNTGFISAHYQPNAWWLSGLATYSRGQYDEQKQVLSSVGTANYDVDSWGVQVMTGYDVKLQNAIITPEVGMRYLSVKQEGYTDTLGTTVEATTSDYLTAIAGVKTAWDLGKIRPSVGINVGYDVISDDVATLNTLANGASYTVNAEALDRFSVGVTTGIEAKLGDRTTLKLEYNGSFRKEYVDHSGMLKLELKF